MAVNDLIRVPDYNDIRNVIAPVMSNGSSTVGYGQNLNSTEVTTGNYVSKTQWDNLRFDIVNAIVHQTGSVPSITVPAIGDLLRFSASQPNFQYLTLSNQANTNRFDIGSGQYAVESKTSKTNSVSFSSSISTSFTVRFSDSNQARYFFNSGCKIRFSSQFVDTLGTSQSSGWTTILNNLGTISFGGNIPAVNFYSLTSSDQTFYSQGSSGTYSMNTWRLQARCNVSNNSTGTATEITFTSTWIDSYTDPGEPPPGDLVQGSMTLNISQLRATGALYPNLIANSFAITSPTYTTPSVIA
jgi:hypothetical protein